MSKGKQVAALLLLGSALSFPHIAIAQGTGGAPGNTGTGLSPADGETTGDSLVEQTDGAEDTYDDEVEQPDISVPGGAIVVTGRRNRDVVRASTQVVNVLSSEEIARTGEGDIAGALSRVTGLSVVGDGFVFVRGLGDRYSLALLNGLPLPSPEPLRRTVPLDLFPTDIVSSSLVQKTYSANFPGEFGGGVINLTTRAIPDESFLKLSASISGDSETTGFNGLTYYGSGSDWTGFDDGARGLTPELKAYFDSGLSLDNPAIDQQAIAGTLVDPNLALLQQVDDVPANFSGSLSAGTAVDIGSDARLGIIFNASLSNSWRNRTAIKQTSADLVNIDTDFTEFQTNQKMVASGLLGIGLEWGDHKARFTNVFIRDTLKQSQLAIGYDADLDNTRLVQDNGWFERQLFDSQAVVELDFGRLGVDLRGGFARTDREAPYEYNFEYVRTDRESDPIGDVFINLLNGNEGDASVAFSDLNEELWYGGIDLNYEVFDATQLTFGYAHTDTSRYSERRAYTFRATGSGYIPPDVDAIDPTPYRVIGSRYPSVLLSPLFIDYFNIGLIDQTPTTPAFQADLTIDAGYGKMTWAGLSGLTVDLGVRYEDATQIVAPVSVFSDTAVNTAAVTNIANDYWLPSGTITYEVTPELQLRASASKTIARPQFRELIFQPYRDPDSSRVYEGNPFLKDSELTNFEARAEYYLGRGNRVSLAGFYKDIERPIEAYSNFSDNSQVTRYANAPAATLWGAEFELNYGIDLYSLGSWFETKRALVVTNYTYTQSEIKVSDGDTTATFPSPVPRPANLFFSDGLPLTGQSDHLLNVQLGMEDTDKLQQFTVLFSYASKRVTSRGTLGLPDIVEDPGLRIDLVAREGTVFMGVPIEIKAEARNITGRDHFEYQSDGTNRIEINSYDVGRSFSLGISAEF
ncbi:TonB-dependent receptor domain-containing protein [Croceicoccus naphthovorans]|uniref:TonB-dependent receptor n=2 Tax=Croceicoccus naphthovorans TaxID=1348774 RepID=A0A0G3XLV1_9SPHN|nr:TonB-dependent receptor [Croceicoccus naphthovorans]AKM11601.1 TonB-dependent receptor [Croceicoccus naphthovorans]MBB3990840.1 TonB-dependent receptor [Croceicoccus naphthovorans]